MNLDIQRMPIGHSPGQKVGYIECRTCYRCVQVDPARFLRAPPSGAKVDASEKPTTNKYVKLGSGNEQLIVLAQKVPHPSRVHLDIETDDIEAEVKRLAALGARRIEQIETWWVMEAPTGHRFCVIRAQRDGKMPDDANQWE